MAATIYSNSKENADYLHTLMHSKPSQQPSTIHRKEKRIAMNDNEPLPSGCRSELANALHADDPGAVAKCLDVCSLVERSNLTSEQCGKSPHAIWKLPAWSYAELKQFRARQIDNSITRFVPFSSRKKI